MSHELDPGLDGGLTAVAQAYRVAMAVRDEREEAERLKAEAESLEALSTHIYDPRPYREAEPVDLYLYEGTEIGALYGLPGCEHVELELGDWTIGKEPVT